MEKVTYRIEYGFGLETETPNPGRADIEAFLELHNGQIDDFARLCLANKMETADPEYLMKQLSSLIYYPADRQHVALIHKYACRDPESLDTINSRFLLYIDPIMPRLRVENYTFVGNVIAEATVIGFSYNENSRVEINPEGFLVTETESVWTVRRDFLSEKPDAFITQMLPLRSSGSIDLAAIDTVEDTKEKFLKMRGMTTDTFYVPRHPKFTPDLSSAVTRRMKDLRSDGR